MTLPINWDRPVTVAKPGELRRLLNRYRNSADPCMLLMHTNARRHQVSSRRWSRRDLPQLQWSDELANAAKFHAMQMATLGFFGHMSPLGDTPEDRARTAGYTHDVAEIISRGRCTTLGTFYHWAYMGGPKDDDWQDGSAIYDPDAKVMGAAQYDWYWVAMFGGELP
jgi:uncharacterized protein YkwD